MSARSSSTVGAGLLDIVAGWDVHELFICPGSTEAAVLDALVDRDDVTGYLVTHDSVAVSMADGYARASGRPGVAYLHANVGLTNGLSHLATAHAAGSPVVVLNGLKATVLQNRGGFTTAPHMADFVRDYVVWDAQPATGDIALDVVGRGFDRAMSEPRGPVWIGLAEEVVEAEAGPAGPRRRRDAAAAVAAPDSGALDRTAAAVAAAARPVIVAGSGVVHRAATAELLALAERFGLPVLAEDRRSLTAMPMPNDHERFAGYYSPRHPLVRDADLLVFVGARCFVEFLAEDIPLIPDGPTVVHAHADASEIGQLYGVDIAVPGDERQMLAGLTSRLAALGTPLASPPWTASPTASPAAASPASTSGNVAALDRRRAVRTIAARLPEDTVVVADAVTATTILLDELRLTRPDGYHASTAGSLGWGMGAALGVRLAMPDRPVVAFLGDGSFQFGVQALWTAAHYELPVVYVVLNNEAYAAVGAALQRYGGRATQLGVYPGTDLSGPDLAAVAAGFGVNASRVRDESELDIAVAEALASKAPAVVEVMTQPRDWI